MRSRPSILHFPAGTDSSQRRSPGRVFSRLSHTDAQIDTLLATKNLDFTIRMDRTQQTRFGVWSQKAPDVATGSLTSAGDTSDTGTLADSFLELEPGMGLTFAARQWRLTRTTETSIEA